jgi:hypothetical protein
MHPEQRNGSKSPNLFVVDDDDDLQEARCVDMEWINPA